MHDLNKIDEDFFAKVFECAELLLGIKNKVDPFCVIQDFKLDYHFVYLADEEKFTSKIDFMKFCRVAGIAMDARAISIIAESWKVDGVNESNQEHIHSLFLSGRISEWGGAKECVTAIAQFDTYMYASVSREIDRTVHDFPRMKELVKKDVEISNYADQQPGNFNHMLPPSQLRKKIKPMAVDYLNEAGIKVKPMADFQSIYLPSQEYQQM